MSYYFLYLFISLMNTKSISIPAKSKTSAPPQLTQERSMPQAVTWALLNMPVLELLEMKNTPRRKCLSASCHRLVPLPACHQTDACRGHGSQGYPVLGYRGPQDTRGHPGTLSSGGSSRQCRQAWAEACAAMLGEVRWRRQKLSDLGAENDKTQKKENK